jgi:hypothetical protein
VNETGNEGKPDTDILRLRAEARALLQDPDNLCLITQWVGARRDSEGRLLGPNFNFTKAEVGGRMFERGETETLACFEARVKAEMPAVRGDAQFWSDDEQSVL